MKNFKSLNYEFLNSEIKKKFNPAPNPNPISPSTPTFPNTSSTSSLTPNLVSSDSPFDTYTLITDDFSDLIEKNTPQNPIPTVPPSIFQESFWLDCTMPLETFKSNESKELNSLTIYTLESDTFTFTEAVSYLMKHPSKKFLSQNTYEPYTLYINVHDKVLCYTPNNIASASCEHYFYKITSNIMNDTFELI